MNKESIVQAEYAAAKREGRQPRCPYCHAVLGVRQLSRRDSYWRWDGKRFEKRISDEVDEPYCVNCQTLDWHFIDNDFVRLCDPPQLSELISEDIRIIRECVKRLGSSKYTIETIHSRELEAGSDVRDESKM